MEVTIFIGLLAMAMAFTVLFHKIPNDKVSIDHGARVQKIGLGVLSIVVWFTLALLSTTIDYIASNGVSTITTTVDTIYLTYIFFGVGVYFILMTFMTFLEHVEEEVSPEDESAGIAAIGEGMSG